MRYKKSTWDQLKNKSPKDLMKALEKDGAALDSINGAVHVYRYSDGKRVTIHLHPGAVYGRGLMKALLADIGWTEARMREIGLVK